MTEHVILPELSRPVVITAFEGWNDAGEAATDAVDHMRACFGARLIAELDPEEYYDFQVNRPHVRFEGGERVLVWPTTRIFAAKADGRDIVLVHGVEPNMKWRSFCGELVDGMKRLGARLVVNLGALLADVPHTRPVPTSAFASNAELASALDVEAPTYEGPTGIVGVLQHACDSAGLPSISLWAAVPHYVASTPCPKAALALLGRLEDIIDETIPVGDLPDDAESWQAGVDEMAAQDEEIARYVARLEQARDSEALTAGSGDVIAAEFERYLRQQRRKGSQGPGEQ